MTMLGLAMFRSTGLMERLGQLARQAALLRGRESRAAVRRMVAVPHNRAGHPLSCAASGYPDVGHHPRLRRPAVDSLNTLGELSWAPLAYTYTPQQHGGARQPAAAWSARATAIDVNYYNKPGVYVENLGLSRPQGHQYYYQATAYGYGGSANTMSVLRSTYLVRRQRRQRRRRRIATPRVLHDTLPDSGDDHDCGGGDDGLRGP